jgi:hypothetical protein
MDIPKLARARRPRSLGWNDSLVLPAAVVTSPLSFPAPSAMESIPFRIVILYVSSGLLCFTFSQDLKDPPRSSTTFCLTLLMSLDDIQHRCNDIDFDVSIFRSISAESHTQLASRLHAALLTPVTAARSRPSVANPFVRMNCNLIARRVGAWITRHRPPSLARQYQIHNGLTLMTHICTGSFEPFHGFDGCGSLRKLPWRAFMDVHQSP